MMVAEILASAGHSVIIYDRMPSLGRKFLMAGRGGLNLTHSENIENFINRYGAASTWIAPYINAFPPSALRAWCEGLGQETFIGSSGRVFPRSMKAAPLLRAWLQRLDRLGVRFCARHFWQGWEGDSLKFIDSQKKIVLVKPDVTLLAMGGASWPRLGSNGGWADILAKCGVKITPFKPANCGFITPWSTHFSARFAGVPLKSVSLSYHDVAIQGEVMITAGGLEGGVVYAISASLREAILAEGEVVLHLDLRPGMSLDALTQKLTKRGAQSFSTYLRKAGFSPVAINLLREVTPPEQLANATVATLATLIKSVPITLIGTTGLARAISTAGGIELGDINADFMLNAKPGVFVAGEMLDWEAPTGGYLLQGCFSTAIAAAKGVLNFLAKKQSL